jgi:hypothetical protein
MVFGGCWRCCRRKLSTPARACVVLSEEASRRAQANWRCVVRRLLRIRFRQRLWGLLGQYLQFIVGDWLRARLLRCLPSLSGQRLIDRASLRLRLRRNRRDDLAGILAD